MSDKTPFFVGYLPVPGPLRKFLMLASALLVVTFLFTGLLIGSTQDEPPASGFRFDYGRQTVTGVVELTPYPLLRVTEGNDHIKPGKTLMLSGAGTIDMLQLRGGRNGFRATEGIAPEMETEPLGRWKIAGEICDGKCLNGAMRPGRGLAHKACANLCLLGDVPPVFVSSQPIEGTDFMLITGRL